VKELQAFLCLLNFIGVPAKVLRPSVADPLEADIPLAAANAADVLWLLLLRLTFPWLLLPRLTYLWLLLPRLTFPWLLLKRLTFPWLLLPLLTFP
jgi:hypothetical protein